MTRTTLAERQARLEQQRARLQLEENRLREAERKARTRRLIEAGGLVEKAGLLELDTNALYGALLSLAAKLGDPAELARWQAEGGRAFEREAKAREIAKEPLILTFDGTQAATVTARLRALGFSWSKVMRHWEGMAAYGGALRRVQTDAAPASGDHSAAATQAAE